MHGTTKSFTFIVIINFSDEAYTYGRTEWYCEHIIILTMWITIYEKCMFIVIVFNLLLFLSNLCIFPEVCHSLNSSARSRLAYRRRTEPNSRDNTRILLDTRRVPTRACWARCWSLWWRGAGSGRRSESRGRHSAPWGRPAGWRRREEPCGPGLRDCSMLEGGWLRWSRIRWKTRAERKDLHSLWVLP